LALFKVLTYTQIPETRIKMYLIKGDEVKIVKEKDGFLKIYYFGKNRIKGWIKKSDVE